MQRYYLVPAHSSNCASVWLWANDFILFAGNISCNDAVLSQSALHLNSGELDYIVSNWFTGASLCQCQWCIIRGVGSNMLCYVFVLHQIRRSFLRAVCQCVIWKQECERVKTEKLVLIVSAALNSSSRFSLSVFSPTYSLLFSVFMIYSLHFYNLRNTLTAGCHKCRVLGLCWMNISCVTVW